MSEAKTEAGAKAERPAEVAQGMCVDGYHRNEAGLNMFNSLHDRQALSLYTDGRERWYVVYKTAYGIHPDHLYGTDANRRIRLVIKEAL